MDVPLNYDQNNDQDPFREDAISIANLFPEISYNHIIHLLTLFADMPERKEIILRLFRGSETYTNSNNFPDCARNLEQPNRSKRKLEENNTDDNNKIVKIDDDVVHIIEDNEDQCNPMEAYENFDDSFDLVQYLSEKSGRCSDAIFLLCLAKNINIWKKPSVFVLDELLADIQENKTTNPNTFLEPFSPENFFQPSTSLPNHISVPHSQEVIVQTSTTVPAISQENNVQPSTSKMAPIRKSTNQIKLKPEKVYLDKKLVQHLEEIFPDACPEYIKHLCEGKIMDETVVNELINIILEPGNEYPKRPAAEPEGPITLDVVVDLLPDADPDYLAMKFDEYEGRSDELKLFINQLLELRNYPTRKEYERLQQLSAQSKQYTTEFNVANFVKIIPNPDEFFLDPKRNIQLDERSRHYALTFLRNTFNRLPIRTIQSAFNMENRKLLPTVKRLNTMKDAMMKTKRKCVPLPNTVNIPLLQEVAYITHAEEISAYIEETTRQEAAEHEHALQNGLMKTCQCCYNDCILPKNIIKCPNGCEFCKTCIIRSTEILYSENKLNYPCLSNCQANFDLVTLQSCLPPRLFSKIAQKKALEEVKSAGIEDLVTCPFCDFASIPDPTNRIFSCMNPECMKESCRLCKEPSHIPLACDEIESNDEVKQRTYIENKMTEAMLRTCWKCGIKYFKTEGCNKMTCECGAKMCYLCKQPVTDYKHFNGQGGTNYELCPLFSNTEKQHRKDVLVGGRQAKKEIGVKQLKYDPTKEK